ncbi:hypothetical protein KNT64_gp205 [Pseudomonas phage PspYZU05]|uniref:Uncharacterized protein n=1 Tax=Pseudomonas phage PspYZU05 TaxID=1983556 RepID=A0A2U7NN52_9CAUD|nr:hypothetical protein KNT64_gp205 [Pseudomonas phage PspYZU05]ASD52157.1 hypothetical protein PspYZU05_205 [Pseudomonas phage PspYZU05]
MIDTHGLNIKTYCGIIYRSGSDMDWAVRFCSNLYNLDEAFVQRLFDEALVATKPLCLVALKDLRNLVKANKSGRHETNGICNFVDEYIGDFIDDYDLDTLYGDGEKTFKDLHDEKMIGFLKSPIKTIARVILTDIFPKWPKFSGRLNFPVPSIDECNPGAAFVYNDKWKGEYGDLRKELLDFLIEELDTL